MSIRTRGFGWLHVVIAVAGTVLLATAARAERTLRPLEITDAVWALDFQVQGVLATFSPDGELVASVVCDPRERVADEKEGTGHKKSRGTYLREGCDIWLTPTRGGASRNLTGDDGNNWAPSWSPDGRLLAFCSDRDGASRIWLWDRGAGTVRRAGDTVARAWMGYVTPLWTSDGRALVVQASPEGVSEEELEPAMGKGGPEIKDKEPGSTVVIFRSPPEPPKEENREATPAGFAQQFLCDIVVIDLASGQTRILARHVHPAAMRLSPDSRRLAYLDARAMGPANFIGLSHAIVVLDLVTGTSRDIVTGVLQTFSGAMSWSPDGRWLAYTAATPRETAADRIADVMGATGGGGELFVVSAGGGEPSAFSGKTDGSISTDFVPPRWDPASAHVFVLGDERLWKGTLATWTIEPLIAEAPYEVRDIVATSPQNGIWTPDGGRSLHVCTRDRISRKAGFYRVDTATGRAEKVWEEDKRIGVSFEGPVTSPDGRWVTYLAQSAEASPDLWIAGAGFSDPRRLTTINPQLDQYAFGEGRLIDFRSLDGEPLRAAVVLPAGYQKGKRYPTMVWVYASDSGSRAVHHFGLVGISAYNMQMLATRGYAVVWPDIPVRTGTPARDLLKAVMPAVDRLVELGITDPDRIAVMGQSNGGYSTLALVTQTTRFKAAVMNAGFGDLVGFYGSMSYAGTGGWIPWLERAGGGMGAPPWEAPLRYVENSPVFYLDRITTPLIVQAGGDDEGIIRFSDQVWVGLQRLGKEATYLRYGGEDHVLMQGANLVDYWRRVIAFLDGKVKNAEPSVAP
jgi:dipeptidyl aminopeptidase/acylaminoacyl peptidase